MHAKTSWTLQRQGNSDFKKQINEVSLKNVVYGKFR